MERDEVFSVGVRGLLEARTKAGVELVRDPDEPQDPDDPPGWRLSWHGDPDEDTMRRYSAEAMAEVSSDFTIPITSYVRERIDFDQLAEEALFFADPRNQLSRADRRALTADARQRLRALAQQGGWPAVRTFMRHAGDSPCT